HHRGYLFYGEPGTGKTSMISALANHFTKNLAVLSLNSIKTDEQLAEALANAPNNAFIVIEDIDACGVNVSRTHEEKQQGITFSGLLNALDGIITADETVIFMTTNHIDRLDPALIRPGRVDLKEEFY